MGRQRVVTVTAERGGPLEPADLQLVSGSRRPFRPCPLSVLGVTCSPDVKIPTPPADAFGEHAVDFPSTNAVAEAGSLALALAQAGRPVPASLCCDMPRVSPARAIGL